MTDDERVPDVPDDDPPSGPSRTPTQPLPTQPAPTQPLPTWQVPGQPAPRGAPGWTPGPYPASAPRQPYPYPGQPYLHPDQPAPYPYAAPPPYYPAPYGYPPQETEGTAVAALVLSIASWVLLPIVGAVVALILASSAKRRIRDSDGRYGGHGLVTAAQVISWLQLVPAALLVVFLLFVVLPLAATA